MGQNTGREIHRRLICDWINRRRVKFRTGPISKTSSCLVWYKHNIETGRRVGFEYTNELTEIKHKSEENCHEKMYN